VIVSAGKSTYAAWIVRSLLAAAVAAVVLWCFPVFHVVPLEEAQQRRSAETFHAEEYARTFLEERLPREYDKAVDAATLMATVRKDPDAAKSQYGTTLPAKSEYYYFVRGKGRIVGVEANYVALALDGKGPEPDVLVATGPVFNNALRDATGLILAVDFANQQDFNGIKQHLNRIVEQRVLPPFREQAKLGADVEFVGCAEIAKQKDLDPMWIVPIVLQLP
jgi:predicted lipoprotein